MTKPEILILAPMPDFLAKPLMESYLCHWGRDVEELESALPQAADRVRGIVMAGGTVVPEALLQRLPALEIMSVNGVGYDGVPLAACKTRGIRVTNTPDVLTDDVADIALALVLMTSRGLIQANRDLHADRWKEGTSRLTQKVAGKKVGIVGLGRIGKAIARRLEGFDVEIGYHGRSEQAGVGYRFFAELFALATWSDFLIVACPGGSGTKHLIDAAVIDSLGPRGILINVSRGSVVDENALIAALEAGKIAGAGLDVFENEPVVPEQLKDRHDVVLLPHVGSATRETRGAMAQLVLDNLAAHFASEAMLTPVI